MANKAFLLDTNAAIARINGDSSIVVTLEAADELFTSVIVLGELYFGAEKSGRVQHNKAQVDKLAAEITVLNCDEQPARLFGRLSNELQRKGRPNQPNDIWIAATALQYNLILLTRDNDFANVDGLTVQSW